MTRGFHEGLGAFLLHAGEANVQPGRQADATMSGAKIHLGINSHFRWQRDLLFAGDQLDRR